MRLRTFALGLALVASTLVARADEQYTVSFSTYGDSGTYTFLEPSILSSPFTISAADLSSSVQSGDVLAEINLNPTDSSGATCFFSGYGACINLSFSPPGGSGLAGVNEAFTAALTSPGSYTSPDNEVTVSIEPYVAATPEPGSLALLGTAVLGMSGVLRKRLARR